MQPFQSGWFHLGTCIYVSPVSFHTLLGLPAFRGRRVQRTPRVPLTEAGGSPVATGGEGTIREHVVLEPAPSLPEWTP